MPKACKRRPLSDFTERRAVCCDRGTAHSVAVQIDDHILPWRRLKRRTLPVLISIVRLPDIASIQVSPMPLAPHFNVTAEELARHIGVPIQRLKTILDEHAPVTRMLAKRLGASLGHGPDYWLALQLQYDLWHGSLKSSFQAR